jgi:hypothetical protein
MDGRGFAGAVVRRRAWVVLALVAASAALLPLAPQAEKKLDVSGRIPGSESAAVEETLVTEFESPFARNAVAVLSGVPGPRTPSGGAVLTEVVNAFGEVPGVTRTWSYLDQSDALFVGSIPGTFVIVGLDPQASPDTLVPRLRDEGQDIARRLRGRFPAVGLRWTGEPVLNLDFRQATAQEVRAAEYEQHPTDMCRGAGDESVTQ